MTETKVHHNTRKAADVALAKRLISRSSYEAVMQGKLSLAEARELGRDRGPHDTGQASSGHAEGRKAPREGSQEHSRSGPATCLCGCGELVKNRFRPGHDMRLYGELKRNLEKDPLLRNERFNDEQKAYAKERKLI
jgi:hypothetical protein